MIKNNLGVVFKWIVILALIRIAVLKITGITVDLGVVSVVLIIIVGLILIKIWVPFVYLLLRGGSLKLLRALSKRLWQKPEQKGAATVRQPKMRWRQ